MGEIIMYFFIAIALSMDALSISICMSTNKLLNKKQFFIFPILVGILHFIMPYLGNTIGIIITLNLERIANYILGIIFLVLGIEILTSKSKQENIKINNFYVLLIALTVSVDSFTVGLGLSITNEYTLLASLIFSIISCLFTIGGILVGIFLNKHIEKQANIIGSILLFLLALKYIFNF